MPSEVSIIHGCIQWTRSRRMEERNLFRDEKLNSKRCMDNHYRSRPIQAQIIGCRIVLRKNDENGSVNRRKARVIAKGFTQKLGIDFCNIFAPCQIKFFKVIDGTLNEVESELNKSTLQLLISTVISTLKYRVFLEIIAKYFLGR